MCIRDSRLADKAVYSVTEQGREYFEQLMETYADQQVPLLFDFNVVITNLNKMEREKAQKLIQRLRSSSIASARTNAGYADEYADIPLVGRTMFEQQKLLYQSLLELSLIHI